MRDLDKVLREVLNLGGRRVGRLCTRGNTDLVSHRVWVWRADREGLAGERRKGKVPG